MIWVLVNWHIISRGGVVLNRQETLTELPAISRFSHTALVCRPPRAAGNRGPNDPVPLVHLVPHPMLLHLLNICPVSLPRI